jgi:hypothetical protein
MPEAGIQPATSDWIATFNMSEQFRTARMYTQSEPAYDRACVFAITTMELG